MSEKVWGRSKLLSLYLLWLKGYKEVEEEILKLEKNLSKGEKKR